MNNIIPNTNQALTLYILHKQDIELLDNNSLYSLCHKYSIIGWRQIYNEESKLTPMTLPLAIPLDSIVMICNENTNMYSLLVDEQYTELLDGASVIELIEKGQV